jgi:DNA-directed RNA polymerase specialized sigma24 family protein
MPAPSDPPQPLDDHDTITQWIQQLKDGDQTTLAEQQLWDRYFARLVGLARAKLGDVGRRVCGEEDVALSVMATFYRRAKDQRFPRLQDRHGLWPLLVKITARKASNVRRDARAAKRGRGQTRGDSVWLDGASQAASGWSAVPSGEPTPEFAVQVAEQCQRLLQQLNASQRAIVELKLQAYTTHEIADKLQTSCRTVERRLEQVRTLLSERE